MNKKYLCIDLKSFYASVECIERGLDPMKENLVVADLTRTEKTICLAVTPALKAYGISGRARLFEVIQKVKGINTDRLKKTPNKQFDGESSNSDDLKNNPSLKLSYIVAPPRMAHYMEVSTQIYNIYLKYVSPEDIHVYSIDEVFIDITGYLGTYKMSAYELAMKMIKDVLKTTGITATAGIGTNMYLAKIAMDIKAKKMPADSDGVRIAELDEMSYRRELWNHQPLTDFWRVGGGYYNKLIKNGLYTMGDIARCSTTPNGERMLYKLFGVNAELLIDHAWGWEPCTIADVKAYIPENRSLGMGQVLTCPYDFKKARVVVREMVDLLSLDLVKKRVVTDQIVLTIGYDIQNLTDLEIKKNYHGEISTDRYGRKIPKHSHGTANIGRYTSSTTLIMGSTMELYDKIINEKLLVRRINISANHVIREDMVPQTFQQLDLFADSDELVREENSLKKERKIQEAIIDMKSKFGKNAVLNGTNLQEGATAKKRNEQIGGHKA